MEMDEVCRFETGAVRSNDVAGEAWELLSPVAMEVLGDELSEQWVDIEPDYAIECCLMHTFWFLKDSRTIDHLHFAAIHLLFHFSGEVLEQPVGMRGLPYAGLRAVARAAAEGSKKYGDYNWEKGMPVRDLLRHGIRHIYLHLSGDTSEPHLDHAAWNYMAAVHSYHEWPALNEGTLRPQCLTKNTTTD